MHVIDDRLVLKDPDAMPFCRKANLLTDSIENIAL